MREEATRRKKQMHMTDERPKIVWTDSENISDMMGVLTAACTMCRGPARVPEDVAAIRMVGEKQWALVVCEKCAPKFMEKIDEKMREIAEEL